MRNNTKNIVIMSDSSKACYGGGDRISEHSIAAFKGYYDLYAVDYTDTSKYIKSIENEVSHTLRLPSYGKITRGMRASFSLGILEILSFPFFMINNTLVLLRYFRKYHLGKRSTVLYPTTKKQLIQAYLLHFFGYQYIYHAHSVDNRKSLFYRIINHPQKKATCILCVSEFVKKNIALPQCVKHYNPVKSPVKHLIGESRLEGDRVVASFSTLIGLKGIEYFMRSARFLTSEDVRYEVYGQGEEFKNLERLQSARVRLKGFCPDVSEVLPRVYLVVVPSVAPESFGLTILEANSFGIPVITTHIGAQSELVQDGYNGFLVPPKDPEAIAQKIDVLMEDTDRYLQMSRNAQEYAQRFSVSNYAKRIREIFDRVFSESVSSI